MLASAPLPYHYIKTLIVCLLNRLDRPRVDLVFTYLVNLPFMEIVLFHNNTC